MAPKRTAGAARRRACLDAGQWRVATSLHQTPVPTTFFAQRHRPLTCVYTLYLVSFNVEGRRRERRRKRFEDGTRAQDGRGNQIETEDTGPRRTESGNLACRLISSSSIKKVYYPLGCLGNPFSLLVITCQSSFIRGHEEVTLSRDTGVRSLPAVARIPNTLPRPLFDPSSPLLVGLIAH